MAVCGGLTAGRWIAGSLTRAVVEEDGNGVGGRENICEKGSR